MRTWEREKCPPTPKPGTWGTFPVTSPYYCFLSAVGSTLKGSPVVFSLSSPTPFFTSDIESRGLSEASRLRHSERQPGAWSVFTEWCLFCTMDFRVTICETEAQAAVPQEPAIGMVFIILPCAPRGLISTSWKHAFVVIHDCPPCMSSRATKHLSASLFLHTDSPNPSTLERPAVIRATVCTRVASWGVRWAHCPC